LEARELFHEEELDESVVQMIIEQGFSAEEDPEEEEEAKEQKEEEEKEEQQQSDYVGNLLDANDEEDEEDEADEDEDDEEEEHQSQMSDGDSDMSDQHIGVYYRGESAADSDDEDGDGGFNQGTVIPVLDVKTLGRDDRDPDQHRDAVLLLLGKLQIECLTLGIRTSMTFAPHYFVTRPFEVLDGGDAAFTHDPLTRLARYDSEMLKSLLKLRELNTKDEFEALGLYLRSCPVTRDNLEEFLSSRVDERLFPPKAFMDLVYVDMQVATLKQQPWMQLQTTESVQRAMLEIQDSRLLFERMASKNDNLVLYSTPGASDHVVVRWFWEIVSSWTLEQENLRRSLLQFWGSVTWINRVSSKFTLSLEAADRVNPEQRFPSSGTCGFTLWLPRYASKQLLEEKLLVAISPESLSGGFGQQ